MKSKQQSTEQKPRLKTFQYNIQTLKNNIPIVSTQMKRKIVGASLGKRRFRIWKQKPFCNHCNLFVEHPSGYDLDHIIPLWNGGQDTDENCQILCKECHKEKSRKEVRNY